MDKRIVIILMIVVIILIIPIVPQNYKVTENQSKIETYTEKEPYDVIQTTTVSEPYQTTEWITVQQSVQVDKPFSIRLITHTAVAIQMRDYRYYNRTIDISDTKNNKISSTVFPPMGHGLIFMVFDKQEFIAWENDHSKGSPYCMIDEFVYGSSPEIPISFVPTHTDTYYFVLYITDHVLRQGYELKYYDPWVDWSGSRTVTEMQNVQQQQQVTKYHDVQKTQTTTLYRDMEKTRIVTVSVEVTKTRNISLIQLFIGG